MGQAKLRGTKEQRVALALDKEVVEKPVLSLAEQRKKAVTSALITKMMVFKTKGNYKGRMPTCIRKKRV